MLDLHRRRGGCFFFFSSRRRHTRLQGDWSSDVCSSDLVPRLWPQGTLAARLRVNGAVRDVDTTLARPGFSTVELEASSVIGGVRAVLAIRKIGRASCRGRGEISGGAGSFKKKKKESARERVEMSMAAVSLKKKKK